MEHTRLLFLFTCQQTKSSNFSRSGVNVHAHLLRKNYSRNFSSIHSKCASVYFGYSTLLHNIASGKYIVIKVEYGLQLHFKIFLNKSDNQNNH